VRPTKTPIQWITRAFFPGIECMEHKADHSLLSNVEVKNAWSYTSTPPYAFIVCIGKNSIFTFKGITTATLPMNNTLEHWTNYTYDVYKKNFTA
jgi:hypothetical protein